MPIRRTTTPWLWAIGAALLSCMACAPGTSPPTSAAAAHASPRQPVSPLVASLLDLAESALDGGDLAAAQGRYERVLALQPDSIDARVGLAEIAARRGDVGRRRTLLEETLVLDPGATAALRDLAALEASAGKRDRAQELLELALERRPFDPDLLEGLLELTGPAPVLADPSRDEILEAARRHPMDPRARLAAARVHLAAEDRAAAIRELESGYWLGDLDPEAARDIIAVLREIDPDWSDRRVVQTHSWADETVRRHGAWKMRLRVEWLKLSRTLDEALETAFVPMSIASFSSRRADDGLASMQSTWMRQLGRTPRYGVLAAFTERRPPRHPKARLGQAEMLGRRTIVRLEPDESQSRVLIHEVLHLYGAVHVAPGIQSIMNPSGASLAFDGVTRKIVEKTRDRRFEAGGLGVDLFPHVDTRELIDVYVDSLQVNLEQRNAGIARAIEAGNDSRHLAQRIADQAVDLDWDLGQTAQLVAEFLAHDGLYAMGSDYYDLASKLFGPETPLGRDARERAQAFRDYSAAVYRSDRAR